MNLHVYFGVSQEGVVCVAVGDPGHKAIRFETLPTL